LSQICQPGRAGSARQVQLRQQRLLGPSSPGARKHHL